MIRTQNASFLRSAVCEKDFLSPTVPAAVFAGRSNVGKSSVINCLLNRKNFARVGSTPGKTAQINYFSVDGRYFVDLPGYGYAKVSGEERLRWGELMESYFAEPQRVGLGVLIVDARHDPSRDDYTMADYFRVAMRPFCVVANKCDKLKKSEIEPSMRRIREVLAFPDELPLIPFSAEKGTGRGELLSLMEKYL